MNHLPFSISATDGGARAATLVTPHGEIKTPVFMPVGTQGAIRSLSPLHLSSTGSQIILANTYHLSQRPGEHLVAKHGGLHKMMDVQLPILTDSGGFQVFSLKKTQINEEGVTFNYEVDGKKTFLSPENSMEIQQKLGADIAMNFDECLAFGTEKSEAIKSFERTARWAVRCKQAHTREDQALFGIIQGGFWPKLRRQCARQITEIGFDGYALGGLSVGEGHKKMCEVLDYAVDPMPRNAPRYLMGVGRPLDLVEGVARGIDMFDCVIATRHSRSGMFYTDKGRLRITDKRFRNDMYPPDTSCTCYTCTRFTRAYLHHLFRVGEILAASLTTIHNLTWYASFMARMRVAIENGQFEAFRAWVHDMYPEKTDPPPEERAQGASKRQRR
jgi:queuine tRNA-ribosyltransferase